MRSAADVRIRIGTAGWSIPRAAALRFESAGTHLERYSRLLRCAEINSSFHRPHATATYVKWRDSTPVDFRFAVKMPRTITHERKLQTDEAAAALVTEETCTDGISSDMPTTAKHRRRCCTAERRDASRWASRADTR